MSRIFLFVHLLLVTLVSCEIAYEELIVKLDVGSLRGTEMTSENGNLFYAFRGIPYAEPSIGKLRFKPPVPKKSWGSKVLDATQDGPVCPQVDIATKEFMGKEDNCLVVNVYTSDFKTMGSMPVMVYIHGGGFSIGAGISTMYGPRRFIDTGVVLVTLNYRLSALGFLSTADSASPGNYGVLDQNMALKWVKANIAHFGGDPKRVTIFGTSAGGASVTYQTISPLSKGLFQRSIAMSGSALCIWAFQPEPLIWSQKLGIELGCPVIDHEKLVACLRKIPEKNLTESANALDIGFLPLVFVPTVDNHFLPDTPKNLISSGKVNNDVTFFTGITKDEGAMVYAFVMGRLRATQSKFSKKMVKSQIRDVLGTTIYNDQAVNLIEEEYFSGVHYVDEPVFRKKMIEMYSHGLFDKGVYLTAQLMSKNGVETYAYLYDFEGPFTVTQSMGVPEVYGVAHMDDLFMVFEGRLFDSYKKSDKATRVKKTFQMLLTNIARYGRPTPEKSDLLRFPWTPVSADTMWIYHIDDPVTVDIYTPDNDDKFEFWLEKVPEVQAKSKLAIKEKKKDEL